VTADTEGYLNFYAILPHPLRNQCLLRRLEYNDAEQLGTTERIAYAIRAMDYDPKTRMLYTGDEIGYIQKWDVTRILNKMEDEKEKELKHQSTAFMTQQDETRQFECTKEDVVLVQQWRAHKDAINFIQWVPELQIVSSCSFDCNVFVWGSQDGKMVKKGSLVLGNRAGDPDKKDKKATSKWDIRINKVTRFKDEMQDAERLLDDVDEMDF
jgi:WD40 repeat protein